MEATKVFNSHKMIVIAQSVLDELFKMGESGVDAVTLYNFYYYTANWQKTRQTKATGGYCRKALHWGKERLINAKKILAEKKLIIEVQKSQKGVFSEVYIKLPYKATEKTTADLVEGQRTADLRSRPAVGEDTNTTSVNNINATSVDILEEDEDYKNNSNFIAGSATNGDNDITGVKGELQPALDTLPIASNRTNTELINAIISLAKDKWEDEEPENVTPVTRDNIAKRLKEGFTLSHFAKAIDMSHLWSPGVPRTLAVLTATKQGFNGYAGWQDRETQKAEAEGISFAKRVGFHVAVQE